MGRPALTQQDIDAWRAKARQVAIKLFAQQDEVSLRQLASAMGCSHATPYRYFESKEELFMAVRAQCFIRFAQVLNDRLQPIEDPIARIHAVASAYHDHAHAHRAEFRLMFQLGQTDPERYPWAHQTGINTWKIVVGTAKGAVSAGVLEGNPTDIAHMLWASVHGVVTLSLSQRLRMGRQSQDLIAPLVDAICKAHEAKP